LLSSAARRPKGKETIPRLGDPIATRWQVLARLLARRGLARAALAGLALGSAVLAGFALWGTVSGQRAAEGVRAANQTRTAWDRTLVLVSTETDAMNDYVRSRDPLAVERLASLVGSAQPTLTWLRRDGDSADADEVELVEGSYATFTASLREVVAAGRRGSHAQALAKAGEASLSTAALSKQLITAIEVERLHLNAAADRTNQSAEQLRGATLAVLAVDLVLLTLSAALLLSYQHRIERTARASSHRAMHDDLTGLPNRSLFDDRLEQAVLASARTAEPVGLLMVDLNDFKNINDTLGHHHGDVLLQLVAHRLAAGIRAGDTVARLGGDEFAVLLTRVGSVEQAAALADRLLAALREPADLEGEVVGVGASVGIAMCPDHGREARQLLRHADAAMYVAKRGRLGAVVYPGPGVGTADPVADRGPRPAATRHHPGGQPTGELSIQD
jgi:diguanylate cyclase (GGDEF)-like protein